MFTKKWTMLIILATMVATVFSGCAQPTPEVVEKEVVVEKPVVETVVVEKEKLVEKKVVETVVVEKEVPVEKEVIKEVVVTATPMPPTPTPISGPRKGGVVRLALQPPTALDPAYCSTHPEVVFVSTFYDYLVDMLHQPGQVPKPDLALSWESDSESKVWTFKLRDNVMWQHGKKFTSEDVKHTFDRLRDPEVGSVVQAMFSNVDRIETPDDYTVVFYLKESNPDFIYDIADYHTCIVASDIEDYNTTFSSTGPFKVESYVPEDRAVFVRNEDYWKEGLPYLDGIEHIYTPEESAHFEMLHAGDVHFVTTRAQEQLLPLQADPRLQVQTALANTFPMIHFACDRAPFSDNRVRQALKLATDNAQLNEAVLLGYGEPAHNSPLGSLFGDYYLNVPTPKQDIEKAKELLAAAGYPDGIEIDLYTPAYYVMVPLAVAWQQQVRAAGIQVNILVQPQDVYYGGGYWLKEGAGITGWSPRPTPKQFYDLFAVCDSKWNVGHWCDEEFDALATQAAAEPDLAKRAELYRQTETILMERGPFIIPFFVPNGSTRTCGSPLWLRRNSLGKPLIAAIVEVSLWD